MSIRTISTGQLSRMGDQEGLVLQGCGGDPQEWVDGINEILAQEGILKKGAGFEEAYTFRHDGLTCMLFPFKEDMELDVLLRDMLAKCKGKWLVSQVDCQEIRYLFRDYQILDFKRIHPMVQKYAPGKQFGELLIGNYDLLEREREVPLQMSLNELLGETIPVEQILKERIIPCKNRTMNS